MGEINYGLPPKKDFGLPPSTRCGHAQEGNIKKEGEIKEKEIQEGGIREEEILYIIILYRQNLRECKAYQTLLHDRKNVYIHDNSPQGENDSPMAAAPEDLPKGWAYVSDPSNPGLSAAYNAAARYARERGFEWLMITDQDTTYASGAGDRYEKLPNEYPEERIFIPKVRMDEYKYLSPVRKRSYFPHPQQESLEGRVLLRECAVINSGLLIKLDAFEKCGGYNENVFLDFSDFQFIDRFSKVVEYGLVTDETVSQTFSAQSDSKETSIFRFRLFCRSVGGYEIETLTQRLNIKLVVAKRALSLCLKWKSMEPIRIVMSDYFFRK